MRKFKFAFVLLAFFTLFSSCANDVLKVPADELYDYISSIKEPRTYKIKITGLNNLNEFPKYGGDVDVWGFFGKLLDAGIYIDLSATEIPDGMDVKKAFYVWKSLVASPKFLGTVKDNSLKETFCDCSSLKKVTNLPKKLTDMYDTFSGCTSLTVVPEIPDSVTNMRFTFSGCTSLTAAPEIPDSVIDMTGTFARCTSLTAAPEIPDSVTNMKSTFAYCTSLTAAPKIPDSVTDMRGTFHGCSSLTTVPKIPNSVTDMRSTFYVCSSLKIVEFFPDRAAFNEEGKATRDSIRKYAAECFSGVPSTCKIYVDADGVWNNLTSYGAKITEGVMGLADINMFVPK